MQQTPWKARELEILQLLADGLSNGEIGARLHLAADTVRWYNKGIFEKLGAGNRTQAAQRAAELGLLNGGANPTPAGPAALPPIHYANNNGVHIAYQVIGSGPVDLLFIHGFVSHLELGWENPEYAGFFEQLGRAARVILFDKRGVGLSDRTYGAPSLEDTMADARCVLTAAGSRRAYIMAVSEGATAAALLASTYPEVVLGLILYGAVPLVVQRDGQPAWASPPDRFAAWLDRVQQEWGGPWAVERFAPSRARDERFRAWWATTLRAASSPSSIRAVLSTMAELDIRPLLPQIRVRALVMHKTGDQMARIEGGRAIAAGLPNAAWLELPGDDHVYFVDSTRAVSAVIEFMQAAAAPSETRLAIILCLLASNPAWALRQLQAQAGAQTPAQAARPGEGVIALFDSPRSALRAASALLRLGSSRVRMGLHVGECGLGNGLPLPAAQEATHGAANLAPPGAVVVTQTLRDILAGSGAAMSPLPGGDMRLYLLDDMPA